MQLTGLFARTFVVVIIIFC